MANFLKPPANIRLSHRRTNPAVNIELVTQIRAAGTEPPRIIFVLLGESAPKNFVDDWSCVWEFEDKDTEYRDEIYRQLIDNDYPTKV